MFIKEVKKQRSRNSKSFYQYTLAQTSRINGKVKQRALLYLGSDPLLRDKHNRTIVLDILKSKIFNQTELFPVNPPKQLLQLANQYYEKYRLKYSEDEQNSASVPSVSKNADFQEVDISGLDVYEAKEFGAEHLCKQILDKLQIKQILSSCGMNDKDITKSLISIAARAIYAKSEYKTAAILEDNSALKELYNYEERITHKQLYSISDKLYSHKDRIDKALYDRITDMFNMEDKFVIYDISNTYFETRKPQSEKAQYGMSKEKRYDCPIVVFTGVINAEGVIRHSRIYEGGKPDAATLKDMIDDLERYSLSKEKRTIVMDAGIATEDNLTMLRERGYNYVCVSRKRIRDYPGDILSGKQIELTRNGKVELKIFNPEGYSDTWMYVESEEKRRKEGSMDRKLKAQFEEELESIKAALNKKGGTKRINKVWERIGRAKERNRRISSMYEINVESEGEIAVNMSWSVKENKIKEDKSKGIYFIRTNYDNPSEIELWKIYNTIREVESTFRVLKSDLKIRPVNHQNDERIESHIYLTILAYQLINVIKIMLRRAGVNYGWENIVRIMSTQKLVSTKLPAKTKIIHIRKPTVPINSAKKIYDAAGCINVQTVLKKYVVYH